MAIAACLCTAALSGIFPIQAASLFPDPKLGDVVAAALGKSPATLSNSDLSALTCLSARNQQITNLSGLENATNLTGLYLNGNAIQDLGPLRGNLELISLELDQNQITDLRPLSGLTNLTCLSLGGNPVTNYWVISNFTQLASLSVRAGTFRDLTSLRSLSGLESLVLWNNYITDPSPLVGLTNLNRLDLRWNGITDAVPARAWPTNLTSLYLGGNSLSNATSLQNLRNLTLLNLEDNWIRDLSSVTRLTNLNYLVINRNPATNFFAISNLTGLINIELRGNSLTNVDFLSHLLLLTYADLAYNQLSNLSPLKSLTNLTSVVAAGNRLTNYADFAGIALLSNLWLFDMPLNITNISSIPSRLGYLNLERTGLTNISPLLTLTNLTGLALSRNPVADYTSLADLTNLTSLRLEGCSLSDAGFMTGLSQLSFLSLATNQVSDLSWLPGLTNLLDLYLTRNRLTNVQALLSLPHLADVDVSLNFLDLRPGLPTISALQTLQATPSGVLPCTCALGTNVSLGAQCQKVTVIYLPTNQPPNVSAIQHWFIPCSTNSFLPIQVSEYPAPEIPFAVFATSANPSLASILNNPLLETNGEHILSVLAGCDTNNSTTSIAIEAVDDVGLNTNISILVTVVPDLGLATICPNADTNLTAAIGAAAGKPADDVTALDLLQMTVLNVAGTGLGDSCLWGWLTNLTGLYVAGSSISNLNFITNLKQLTDVRLETTSVTNLATLEQLPNLRSLDITGDALTDLTSLTNLNQLTSLRLHNNRITDLSPLASLTNLQFLYLEQNLVTNLTPLALLSRLSFLDVRLNLLDLSATSPAMTVLSNLAFQNTSVQYWPQRGPPVIGAPTQWFISANATSTVPVVVSDNALFGAQFTVGVSSANPGLIENQGLAIAPVTNGVSILSVAPTTGEVGNTSLTITATNDAGLTASNTFLVTVLISQVVSIPDSNLQTAILSVFGRNSGTLTTADLLDLTQIGLASASISNLAGLEAATNLTSLVLDNDYISDLSPLENLAQLSWLSASNNLIGDISPLQRLTSLGYLNLAQNPITNHPAFLSGFAALTNLNLSGNGLTNLFFLTNLTGLTALALDGNRIVDGSPLARLPNLSSVSMSGNLLTNVGFLTNLTQLTSLDLSTNLLTDISPLIGLTQLNQLYLQQNLVTSITSLQGLAGLGYLNLGLNELDLDLNSPAMVVISSLLNAGYFISYLPQFPLDSDGDGMPDDWEIAHRLNPHDPSDSLIDSDGDGVLNLVEYAVGADPTNSADRSAGLIVSVATYGGSRYLEMTFKCRNTPVRLQYVPEVSADGLSWYSDSTHIQQVARTNLDSLFDSVTVQDVTAVTIASPRSIRLKITHN